MRTPLALVLLLAACGQPDQPPQQPEPGAATPRAPAPAGPILPPAAELQGTWDVIGYEPPVRSVDDWVIRVTIGTTRIDAISQCVPFHWLYGVVDGRLVLSPAAHDAPVCARPFTFQEQAFSALMQTAERMTIENGRLIVQSPHGRIFLQRAPLPSSPRT